MRRIHYLHPGKLLVATFVMSVEKMRRSNSAEKGWQDGLQALVILGSRLRKLEAFDGLAGLLRQSLARNQAQITDLGGEDSPICPRYILAEFGLLELRKPRCPLH